MRVQYITDSKWREKERAYSTDAERNRNKDMGMPCRVQDRNRTGLDSPERGTTMDMGIYGKVVAGELHRAPEGDRVEMITTGIKGMRHEALGR